MSKMSEGLSLHIQEEEKEESLSHSTGPHIDSGPLQYPSPQFYNLVVEIDVKHFSLEVKKRPDNTFSPASNSKGINRPRILGIGSKPSECNTCSSTMLL